MPASKEEPSNDPDPRFSFIERPYDPDAVLGRRGSGSDPVHVVSIDRQTVSDGEMSGKRIRLGRHHHERARLFPAGDGFPGDHRDSLSRRSSTAGTSLCRQGNPVEENADAL